MKNIFTNDKFFNTVSVLAIVCKVLSSAAFCVLIPAELMCWVAGLIQAVCVTVLFISYKNHSKNVMKGMLGALLMQMQMECLLYINDHFGSFPMIMNIIIMVIITALLTNHFVINSNRNASPAAIRINQVLCVLVALTYATDLIYYFAIDETILLKLADALSLVGYMCVLAAIVCVESRLDAYRLDREAAGWTEEKGYPENYVHEYEKNK